MSRTWQVQDAKARFSELLETSLAEGPQIVTKRGVEAAVLVLTPEARTDALTPPRPKHRHRASPAFE